MQQAYYNGYIQISEDELLLQEAEELFWNLVADPIWKNVDTDMQEAIDRRDGGERDPAWYAARFIEQWESDALKSIFTELRNPFGHGPGSKEMPSLTPQQIDLAIESCISWAKSLIKRF